MAVAAKFRAITSVRRVCASNSVPTVSLFFTTANEIFAILTNPHTTRFVSGHDIARTACTPIATILAARCASDSSSSAFSARMTASRRSASTPACSSTISAISASCRYHHNVHKQLHTHDLAIKFCTQSYHSICLAKHRQRLDGIPSQPSFAQLPGAQPRTQHALQQVPRSTLPVLPTVLAVHCLVVLSLCSPPGQPRRHVPATRQQTVCAIAKMDVKMRAKQFSTCVLLQGAHLVSHAVLPPPTALARDSQTREA